MNGTLELDVPAGGNPFPDGRLGFYNFSQSDVQYSTFSIDSVVGDVSLLQRISEVLLLRSSGR